MYAFEWWPAPTSWFDNAHAHRCPTTRVSAPRDPADVVDGGRRGFRPPRLGVGLFDNGQTLDAGYPPTSAAIARAHPHEHSDRSH